MGLTHGNVIFDILEPPAFKKYSICWVFKAFFCSTFFYMYFATRPRPALTAVSRPSLKTSFCESSDPCQGPWEVEQCYTSISVGVIVMIKSLNQIACEASAEQIKRGGWILLSRLWANLTLPNWQPGILDPAKLSDNIICEEPSKLKYANIQGNHPPPQGLLYHAKHLSI